MLQNFSVKPPIMDHPVTRDGEVFSRDNIVVTDSVQDGGDHMYVILQLHKKLDVKVVWMN